MWMPDDFMVEDKYQADWMDAHNLRFRPVSPAIRAMAERMRQEPPLRRDPVLNEMDKAVLRVQAQQGQGGM